MKTYTATKGAALPGESGISVTATISPKKVALVGRYGSNQGAQSDYLPNFFAWQIEAPSKRAALAKVKALVTKEGTASYVALAEQALANV